MGLRVALQVADRWHLLKNLGDSLYAWTWWLNCHQRRGQCTGICSDRVYRLARCRILNIFMIGYIAEVLWVSRIPRMDVDLAIDIEYSGDATSYLRYGTWA